MIDFVSENIHSSKMKDYQNKLKWINLVKRTFYILF